MAPTLSPSTVDREAEFNDAFFDDEPVIAIPMSRPSRVSEQRDDSSESEESSDDSSSSGDDSSTTNSHSSEQRDDDHVEEQDDDPEKYSQNEREAIDIPNNVSFDYGDDELDDMDLEAMKEHTENSLADFVSKPRKMPSQPKDLVVKPKWVEAIQSITTPEFMAAPSDGRKKKDVHKKCRHYLSKQSTKQGSAFSALKETVINKDSEWIDYTAKLAEENARLSKCLQQSNQSGTTLRKNNESLQAKLESMTERHRNTLKTINENHSAAVEKKATSHKDALAKKDELHKAALEKKAESHNKTKQQLTEKKEELKQSKAEVSLLKKTKKELENEVQRLERELQKRSDNNAGGGPSEREKLRFYVEKKNIDLQFKERDAQRQLELKEQKENQKLEHKKKRGAEVANNLRLMTNMTAGGMVTNGEYDANAMRPYVSVDLNIHINCLCYF